MEPEEIQNILDNIQIIESHKLAQYILDTEGEENEDRKLTLKKMQQTGDSFPATKRKEVQSIIDEFKQKEKEREEKEWKDARQSRSIEKVNKFIDNYPSGTYYNEAKILLDELNNIKQQKSKIIDAIRNDSSKYTPDDIVELIDSGHITKNDLLTAGVPEVIIENLNKKKVNLSLGETPENIEKGYTEVYFWGLPGSGKTCALSAILSTGVNTGNILTNEGLGMHYMNQLSNVFLTNFGVLPASTHLDQTQYLPFDLRDDNGDNHPIALIELSGEIFKVFYKKHNNLPLNEKTESTYLKVENYLKGENKKIHFFVIDVTVDPRKPIKGDTLTQQQYLNAMSSYLSNNNILKNSAEGVFIVATKSDKLSSDPSIAKSEIENHLEQYYPAFITRLKDAIKTSRIGDGRKIEIIPFTLGDVYFNDLCHFDNTSSRNIIRTLQNKTRKRKKIGFLDSLINWFNQ